MTKKSHLESGFLILYDWLPAFEKLPPKEVKALLLALIARQRENKPMPLFSNASTETYARMIEPCIKRRLDGLAGAKQGHEYSAKRVEPTQGATEGATVAPSPPKRRKEKESKEKHSISISERSEEIAPKGGAIPPAAGGGDGAAARADTHKKNFYGGKKGADAWKKGGSHTGEFSSIPASFDIDEFFAAALARTYGEDFGGQ